MRLRDIRARGLLAPLLTALLLRVLLVIWVENATFDGEQYLAIARNLLRYGVHSASEAPPILPTMVRPPGYSLFLAGVFAIFGESHLAVRLIQALLDAATVGLVYVLAARLALRRPVVAAWVAALCPFTAIYTTYILSETLSIFLATLSLVLLVEAARRPRALYAALCGASLGALILVRPDFGLLPPVAFLFWLLARRSRRSFLKLSAIAAVACLPIFAPWIARNYALFGDVNVASTAIVARAGADRIQPKGFWSWFRTWSDRIGDLHVTAWPYFGGDWRAVEVPDRAIAAPGERREVEAILSRLSASGRDPAAVAEVDGDFARLAKEHASSAPLRTWVLVPARRAVALWVNGRTAGFPLPAASEIVEGRASPVGALAKAAIVAANFGLLVLAAAGAWILRRRRVVLALAVGLVAYRTVVIAYYGGVEPRYVISAFPGLFLLASAALLWMYRAGKRAAAAARARGR